MTSEFDARSFDRAREREAPDSLRGHWSYGAEETIALSEVTLVVAIKSNCDGCRAFLDADLDDLRVPVLIISAEEDDMGEWRDARRPVFISPDGFRLLDVRCPPLYVLVDPIARRALTEGVLFGPAQVASEIAAYLKA
ncbi:MAG TPA: hypothetical protein VMU68_14060 [Acidimicrobiales bacterium]|nr:hypothetical protein [Acidimicrobiales bacterium]